MTAPMTAPGFAGPVIETTSGGWFDFAEPARSTFTLADIVTGLSRLCRFTGQGAAFYSVAEHSVHASRLVPPEHARAALLHDAPEAFLGDVSSPLKSCLPDYRATYAAAERVIFARLGVALPLAPAVKAADLAMLAAEKAQVLRSAADWPCLGGVTAAPVRLEFWTPDEAARQFRARLHDLTPRA